MNEKDHFISSLLAVAKEWQKIALIKECKKDFECRTEETPMEIDKNEIKTEKEIKNDPDLELEVYEDKEYDIEEVKYWNFVAKKRAPKPDVIRTLVYKVPETPTLTKTTSIYNQKSNLFNSPSSSTSSSSYLLNNNSTDVKNKPTSNSDIQITRVLSNNNLTNTLSSSSSSSLSNNNNNNNKNRLNKLNLTALDMAHYNSNKMSNYDYDQLDILKSNPIGSYSQQYNKNENKYGGYNNDRRINRRLPDEIQPLKSLHHEYNVDDNKKYNKNLNIKKRNSDRPQVVIETDQPAPLYAKIATRSRTLSRGSATKTININNNNKNSNKRANDVYDLRQSKRKSINYNENRNDIDVYNFHDDIDDFENDNENNNKLRDSVDDNNMMDTDDNYDINKDIENNNNNNNNEGNDDDDDDDDDDNHGINEDEDSEIDFINQKIDDDDEDFDVNLERKKLKTKYQKALKSTTPRRGGRRGHGRQNENIYSKKYSMSTKIEESIPNNSDLNLPDDMRVTRRLSRRASLNRTSTNSNDFIKKEENNEESDGNIKPTIKTKSTYNRRSLQISTLCRKPSKDSSSSIDIKSLNTIENKSNNSDEINNKPKKKYRSYLAIINSRTVEQQNKVNKKLLEHYKVKHGVKFKECEIKLEQTKHESNNKKEDENNNDDNEKNINQLKINDDTLINVKDENINNNNNNEDEIKDKSNKVEEVNNNDENSSKIDNSKIENNNTTTNKTNDNEKLDNLLISEVSQDSVKTENTQDSFRKENDKEVNNSNKKKQDKNKINLDNSRNKTADESLNESVNTSTSETTKTRRSTRLTRNKAKI